MIDALLVQALATKSSDYTSQTGKQSTGRSPSSIHPSRVLRRGLPTFGDSLFEMDHVLDKQALGYYVNHVLELMPSLAHIWCSGWPRGSWKSCNKTAKMQRSEKATASVTGPIDQS